MIGTPPRANLRIILVEDDALVRMTMAALIEEMGHSVTEASNGHDALAALSRGAADLLMTDRHLPDTTGDDLAELALQMQPSLAIVIATGDAPDGASRHVWLQKPFTGARLKAAIDQSASAA